MPETAVAGTVSELARRGADALAAAGCDTPRLDAELLLCEALGEGWSRALLVTSASAVVDHRALERYQALLERRRGREPVAYILGRKHFRRISLIVDRRVLIPRPETELLVEVGLGLAAGARVADVGTGSGAVALALKDERPDLIVTGIDVSADALAVASGNALRLGLDVSFVQADLLDNGEYDAVLANLPYVPEGFESLAPEITLYEPPGALYAGPDGLDVMRGLFERLGRARLVAVEIGPGQVRQVVSLIRRAGFPSIVPVMDLAGLERVIVGRR